MELLKAATLAIGVGAGAGCAESILCDRAESYEVASDPKACESAGEATIFVACNEVSAMANGMLTTHDGNTYSICGAEDTEPEDTGDTGS